MGMGYRPGWLALLVPAFLTVSACAGIQDAQQPGESAAKPARWSDPATWPGRKLPKAGDSVTIAAGETVLLDMTPPALNGLTIMGKLAFADTADLELTTEWIMLHGELQIGTEARPHTRKATITLTDNVRGEAMMGMGDRGIMISGGTLNLHGDRKNSWTKLAKTAKSGSSSFDVLDASSWRAGDEIVLASTDFDPRQAERRTVTAVSGNTLTVDRPLEYMHFGEVTYGVDERGEVGLLTRNIKIQASDDAAQSYFGGHVMAMVTSRMFVEGVEFNRMGQHMTLARYPIHWHLVGNGAGQYIRDAAIHDTFNRCVTVHGTHNLRIENNVTWNTVGHCFFLEDGIETGNQYVRNLAIQTKCHPTKPCVPTNLAANGDIAFENRQEMRKISFSGKDTLLPSDNTAASFWITNPNNSYIDNVAAGADETGFWLSLPEHPNGAFLGTDAAKAVWPRRTKIGEFRGNVAHSNFDGFMFDRNINENNTFGLTGNSHMPKEDPADPNSKAVISNFDNLTAYKNRNGGIWGRGENHIFRNAKLADNAIGFTHASGSAGRDPFSSLVVDSLFVGETANVGNPVTPEEKAYGRSLPKRRIPDFPIRGYEYYDYRDDVVDTTFVNYQDNARRRAGAMSWLLFTSSGVTTTNTIKGAKFINAKPVDFPKYDKRFDNDNRGGVAWRTAVIHDLDGSVGGVPNGYVLIHDGEHDSVATDETCKVQPTWNAAVCPGDVGRLFLNKPGGTLAELGAGSPVVLHRNGKDHRITGNQSNVRSGTEMKVLTDREELFLSLREMDQGSWVVFELPGYKDAAAGVQQKSMAALRNARETSYFKGRDSLWVKLVVSDADFQGPIVEPVGRLVAQATMAVSR